MSKERIEYLTNKMYYGYLDGDETKEYIEYINKLLKENQQLKEDIKDLDNQKEMMFKNMQLNQLKVCELAKVLDEIREYVDNLPFKDLIPIEVKVIKKILDKVKE